MNAVHRITITGSPSPGDTFALEFQGQTTGPIEYAVSPSTTAENIEEALEALSTIGEGNIQVSPISTTVFDVYFQGVFAHTDIDGLITGFWVEPFPAPGGVDTEETVEGRPRPFTVNWQEPGAYLTWCAEEIVYNVAVDLGSDGANRIVVAFYNNAFNPGISPENEIEDVPPASTVFRVRYTINGGSELEAELEWDESPELPASRNDGNGEPCLACFQSESIALGMGETITLVDSVVVVAACPCASPAASD